MPQSQTLKRFDMPPGNGSSPAYEAFLSQIRRGRSVAMVPCIDRHGDRAIYSFSGIFDAEKMTQSQALRHCVEMVLRARNAAEADGNHPIEMVAPKG